MGRSSRMSTTAVLLICVLGTQWAAATVYASEEESARARAARPAATAPLEPHPRLVIDPSHFTLGGRVERVRPARRSPPLRVDRICLGGPPDSLLNRRQVAPLPVLALSVYLCPVRISLALFELFRQPDVFASAVAVLAFEDRSGGCQVAPWMIG